MAFDDADSTSHFSDHQSMKLLIVENPRPRTLEHCNDVANAPLSASLNSGYALAVARRAGWEGVHLDFTRSTGSVGTLAAALLAENADLILFHWVYSWGHEETVRGVLKLLKHAGEVPCGAFGLFPTLSRTKLFPWAPELDFILAGEFEETLFELLVTIRPGTLHPLPGLALPRAAFLPRPLIDDLEWLPHPDDVGTNCIYPSMNIAASRGCHGDCSFCFIKPYYGCSRRRVRSPASLERELNARLERRPVESLYFIDPSFIGPGRKERERVLALSRAAKAAGLPFGFETRVDTLEDDLLAILAKNGAQSVFLGIESGCDTVLGRINKRITRQQIVEAVGMVRRCDLQLHIGFIMFEPDTTLGELQENYDFLEGLGLLDHPEMTVNLLYHNQIVLYGSPAWQRFDAEQRLLFDPRLPFEARFSFRDERVNLVCSAMGRLASAYFMGTAEDDSASCMNRLFKDAFNGIIAAASNGQPEQVVVQEADFLKNIKTMMRKEVSRMDNCTGQEGQRGCYNMKTALPPSNQGMEEKGPVQAG